MRRHGDGGGIALAILWGVLAIGLVVASAVIFSVSQGVARYRTVAETSMPGMVTFEADAGGTYGIALDQRTLTGRAIGNEESEVLATRCTIVLANEQRLERSGASSTVSASAGGIQRFATFEAREGRTTVDCRYTREFRTQVVLLVFPISQTVQWIVWVLGGASIAATLMCLLTVRRAVRQKDRRELDQIRASIAGTGHPAPPPQGGWLSRQADAIGAVVAEHARAASDAAASHGVHGGAAADLQTPVHGVSFEAYVAAEAALIRDRVPPARVDAHLVAHGIAPGTWRLAQQGWQARMRTDWRVGAAYGQAIEQALKRR